MNISRPIKNESSPEQTAAPHSAAPGIARFLEEHGESPQHALTLTKTLQELTKKLLLPPALAARKPRLTPSQVLFDRFTSLNPLSLKIEGDLEFFVFMELRALYKWASFNMNAFKWVRATELYNRILAMEVDAIPGMVFIKKHPRALMAKLEAVEKHILYRLAIKDFVGKCHMCSRHQSGHLHSVAARTSGKTEFWTRHAYAVNLGKAMDKADRLGKKPVSHQVSILHNRVTYRTTRSASLKSARAARL